jgi:hypothetical protein
LKAARTATWRSVSARLRIGGDSLEFSAELEASCANAGVETAKNAKIAARKAICLPPQRGFIA